MLRVPDDAWICHIFCARMSALIRLEIEQCCDRFKLPCVQFWRVKSRACCVCLGFPCCNGHYAVVMLSTLIKNSSIHVALTNKAEVSGAQDHFPLQYSHLIGSLIRVVIVHCANEIFAFPVFTARLIHPGIIKWVLGIEQWQGIHHGKKLRTRMQKNSPSETPLPILNLHME